MARSDNNLKAVFQDTANAIRAKTGSSEPVVPRDFADEIRSIETGAAEGTFNFSGSEFISLNMQLFYNNVSFINPVTFVLPSTLTSITTNAFQGMTGKCKVYFNSIPTVGSSSYIPADTQYLVLKYYFDISNITVISANNWSSRINQMVFTATGIAVGTKLQPYTANTGAAITWYTDDDTFLNQVTESSSTTATYYARILSPNTRVVWYLKELTLSYAACDIVDGQGNHYDLNNRFIPVGTEVTITPTMIDPNKDILLKFSVNGVDITGTSTTITVISDLSVIVAYSDTNISPILDYNTWEIIRQTCEGNVAANYWAIGDTKTDLGTDGNIRTMRICDMQGLYDKHVVFEQVELEANNYQWNQSSNIDEDNAYNNYSISNMRTTHLPAIMARYSSALQTNLTDTTYKVATNGNNGTILDLTDKLFLPAMKEINVSPSIDRTEERNVLTTFQYYVTHNSNSYKIKYKSGQTSGNIWYMRSSRISSLNYVCVIYSNGAQDIDNAASSQGVAPCFAF